MRNFAVLVSVAVTVLPATIPLWAAEPPDSFTAGDKTFHREGSTTTRQTTWIPVALIAAPPFEKVIPRARMRDEDLVPLSIVPEQVFASFTQGTGQAGSSAAGMYARVSVAFGLKGEIPGLASAKIKAGLEAALQSSCGTSWETQISATGANAGVNYLLTEDALVFAVRSSYTQYTYKAQGAGGGVLLYLPVEGSHTARLFSLDEWNAYAQAKNDKGEYIRDLPTFYCERPLTGNVDQYPIIRGDYPLNAGDRFRGTPRFLMLGSRAYIDHHGGNLSGEMSISSSTFASGQTSVGATLQFEADAGAVCTSVEGAVGATFTHEFSKSYSITMRYQTSSVHEKLDGSTFKSVDYHFELQPRLYGLSITHTPDADFSRLIARRLAFRLQGAAVAGATRLCYVTGNETNLVRAGADGKPLFAPTSQPLATILAANGIDAVWESNVLVFDFIVPAKGVSYGRGVPVWPLVQTLLANGVVLPIATQPPHNLWGNLSGNNLPDPNALVYVGPGSEQIQAWLERLAQYTELTYCGPKPQDWNAATRQPLRLSHLQLNDWLLLRPPRAAFLVVNPQLFDPNHPERAAQKGPWLSFPFVSAEWMEKNACPPTKGRPAG